jgi:hypothetical protein
MSIGSVLTQIFKPAVHQRKLDYRVASNAASATQSIRELLKKINNGHFSVGCDSKAAKAAKSSLDTFGKAVELSMEDARQIRSDAREIRRDMHMQLKHARKVEGGIDSWNRDRAREMQKIEKMADRLVHFKPGKA